MLTIMAVLFGGVYVEGTEASGLRKVCTNYLSQVFFKIKHKRNAFAYKLGEELPHCSAHLCVWLFIVVSPDVVILEHEGIMRPTLFALS